MAQTSDRVSSIAAKYLQIENLGHMISEGFLDADEVAADLKTLSGSALRNDEHRGFRGTITRLLSRKAK